MTALIVALVLGFAFLSASASAAASSSRFRVFIEHTDAFQMLLNSNFPVLVERSLACDSTAEQLVGFRLLKLKSPGRLGDELTLDCSSSGGEQDGSKVVCRNQAGSEIFSATKAMVGVATDDDRQQQQQQQPPSDSFEFDVFPDELVRDGVLSTKTVFNLFERGRTSVLGGPDRLQAALAAANHVYVARIAGYRHSLRPPASPRVRVDSRTTLLGDSLVDFDQSVVCASTGLVLARAVVTCVGVDGRTGTPAPFGPDLLRALSSSLH